VPIVRRTAKGEELNKSHEQDSEDAEKKQHDALLRLVKKDPRTGQDYGLKDAKKADDKD